MSKINTCLFVCLLQLQDNFWTTRGDFLNALGYGPDGKNGWDCELHAIIAVLTGVVGIGDWVNMTNATLVRRLARADGVSNLCQVL